MFYPIVNSDGDPIMEDGTDEVRGGVDVFYRRGDDVQLKRRVIGGSPIDWRRGRCWYIRRIQQKHEGGERRAILRKRQQNRQCQLAFYD